MLSNILVFPRVLVFLMRFPLEMRLVCLCINTRSVMSDAGGEDVVDALEGGFRCGHVHRPFSLTRREGKRPIAKYLRRRGVSNGL